MVQSASSPLGVIDGKYHLLRKLGEGGMGAVYEARHLGTGRRVAVKVIAGEGLARSPDVVGRFRREAMASGAIESQHIAQVFDTGVDSETGSPYTVMEMLVGEDVEQAIHRLGPLAPDLALRIAAQACLGLRKAHEAGVIHRDIKPANLFLARREEGDVAVKLLDFGIAKVRPDQLSSSENAGLTKTGAMLGSPLYMSPEQARGKKDLDHRTDIWSLGVVLYEALTGTTPHGHLDSLGELIFQICSVPARHVQEHSPWVSPDVARIVHRALALDPAQRFPSVAEMHAALRVELPQGHAMTEEMFVALPQHLRGVAAPRLELSSGVRAPAPSYVELPVPSAGGAVSASGTMTGVANTHSGQVGRARPSRVLLAAPVVMAVGVALGVVGWKRLGPPRAPVDGASVSPASVPPSRAPAAQPDRAPSKDPSPAPAPSVAAVLPAPSSAKVELAAPAIASTGKAPAPRPTTKRTSSPPAAPTARVSGGMHMDMK